MIYGQFLSRSWHVLSLQPILPDQEKVAREQKQQPTKEAHRMVGESKMKSKRLEFSPSNFLG